MSERDYMELASEESYRISLQRLSIDFLGKERHTDSL